MKKNILLNMLILFCVYANAQQAFNNNGNLQIHSGASVAGLGNFTNASSGVLVNNGSLYIKGNLTNNQASMSAGSGTLFLNGSSLQTVTGSQVFKAYNLETNNSAGISLDIDLSVSGLHTFTSGLISTDLYSTPNLLFYEAGASHTGSNDSRHVNGGVKKSGSTDFTCPVGDATYLRSADITNLSASSLITCHYYKPTSNIYNLTSPLVKVKANEYWQIDKISGGTAQITLNWDHSKVAMDNVLVADILTAQYTGGNWTSTGGTASGNVTTTGTTITTSALSSIGRITFGYKSFPVPLHLLSFTAERRAGTSYLKWITENEVNVNHFDVQRSYDGSAFATIGNVAARNTGSLTNYYFEDHTPLNGIEYYRVKSIDVDGKFSFSRIAAVSETDLHSNTFVVLNPVRNAIIIFNKTGQEGRFNYRVFNSGGLLISEGSVSMGTNGGTVLPLPPQTAAGIYILELANDKTKFSQKIMVEK
jgi:hypothetical protein